MSAPIVIIETSAGQLEALYSNTEIKFIIVDRQDEDTTSATGPFCPTLQKQDLGQIARELCIPSRLLSAEAKTPFF